MSAQLDEKLWEEKFLNRIDLGERPEDPNIHDESDLASAMPLLWSRTLEVETSEKLNLSPFIGTAIDSAIVEKKEILKTPGQTLYINKIGQLTADGDLGTTHRLRELSRL